jgi:oligo-1,6-glucosidase
MRVNDDYEAWNVSAQVEDESSVWSFWKQALQVRKQYDVLVTPSSSIFRAALDFLYP